MGQGRPDHPGRGIRRPPDQDGPPVTGDAFGDRAVLRPRGIADGRTPGTARIPLRPTGLRPVVRGRHRWSLPGGITGTAILPAPVATAEPRRRRHLGRGDPSGTGSGPGRRTYRASPVGTRTGDLSGARTDSRPARDVWRASLAGTVHPGGGDRRRIHAGRGRPVAPRNEPQAIHRADGSGLRGDGHPDD